MGFIVILPFAVLAGWGIFRIYRWLSGAGFGAEWRRRFVIHAVVGLVAGVWCVAFCRYNVARMRIESFPIPTAIWSSEDENKPEEPLVRHVLPFTVRGAAAVTDVLCATLICLAPLGLAAFLKENKGKIFDGAQGGNG